MQLSHTGLAGQALQIAHWLGSQDQLRSEARPGAADADEDAEKNLKKRRKGMNSIYCDLLVKNSSQLSTPRPPTMDSTAALRWARRTLKAFEGFGRSPWLHEEVAKRMQERLAFIKLQPSMWVAWEPLRSGLAGVRKIQARYPQAQCHAVATQSSELRLAEQALRRPWWHLARWIRPVLFSEQLPKEPAQMLWANMLLHQSADPEALIAQWHRVLAVDGFVMFSCLGPDTLRELRSAYAAVGWAAPAHEFTDMHDWGDMLVQAGFAEPVMDMERITLTYESPERLLNELRELGRNLSVHRRHGLRGQRWLAQLKTVLVTLAQPDHQGRLVLTFEIIYGHALKPQPRVKLQAVSEIGLDDMRAMLRQNPRIECKA